MGHDRLGVVKVLTDDIKAAKKSIDKRLPLSPDGGEIIVSFEFRNQEVVHFEAFFDGWTGGGKNVQSCAKQ